MNIKKILPKEKMKSLKISVFAIFLILLSPALATDKELDITISNKIIRNFILNNPEVILESLKLYEKKVIFGRFKNLRCA